MTIGKPAQLSIEDGTVSSSVSPHKGAAGDKPVRELVEGIDGFTLSSAAGQMFRHAKGDYRTEKLIPPELWHPSVRRLVAPLYVYNHGMHIVAVQKASEGREEGVYITNPWSSSYPVGNPAGFTLEKIDNHIFRFVRTRQQDKKQRQQ